MEGRNAIYFIGDYLPVWKKKISTIETDWISFLCHTYLYFNSILTFV